MLRTSFNRQSLLSRIALAVFGLLTAATFLLALFNDKGVLQVYARSKQLDQLSVEIQSAEQENSRLADEINALRTDPTTVEKFAREDLKLVRPGEVVIVLPEKAHE